MSIGKNLEYLIFHKTNLV